MELKKHLKLRYIFIGIYVAAFLTFLIYGLMPASIAEAFDINGKILIPSIELDSNVTSIELTAEGFTTPDTIVGSYSRNKNKTLMIGHSTTVFNNLKNVNLGDDIEYNGKIYSVKMIDMLAKNKINMDKLLRSEEVDTLVIMTCAGKLLDRGDATHRLIVTASSE